MKKNKHKNFSNNLIFRHSYKKWKILKSIMQSINSYSWIKKKLPLWKSKNVNMQLKFFEKTCTMLTVKSKVPITTGLKQHFKRQKNKFKKKSISIVTWSKISKIMLKKYLNISYLRHRTSKMFFFYLDQFSWK